MKTIALLPLLLAACTLIFGLENCEDKCGSSVSVQSVQPNTNPAGYEVLLKTEGFSDATKVIFGSVEATSRTGGAPGDIIATVPAGLSGNVEVSVEEGECIARSGGFIVSGSLPGNVQPSLQQIVVPILTSAPQGGFENDWINAASIDKSQRIHLGGNEVASITILDGVTTKEIAGADNPFFNNNPVTGVVNVFTNLIYLEIDRTAKGGIVEHFDGSFIERPAFLPPPPNSAKPQAILLVSRDTGRQLLLYTL